MDATLPALVSFPLCILSKQSWDQKVTPALPGLREIGRRPPSSGLSVCSCSYSLLRSHSSPTQWILRGTCVHIHACLISRTFPDACCLHYFCCDKILCQKQLTRERVCLGQSSGSRPIVVGKPRQRELKTPNHIKLIVGRRQRVHKCWCVAPFILQSPVSPA